jgi:hypothetical protein
MDIKQKTQEILELMIFIIPLFLIEIGFIWYGIIWQILNFPTYRNLPTYTIGLMGVSILYCIIVGMILYFLICYLYDTIKRENYEDYEEVYF